MALKDAGRNAAEEVARATWMRVRTAQKGVGFWHFNAQKLREGVVSVNLSH